MSQAYTAVKTIFAAALEASRRPGATFIPMAYSTLNEYFAVEHGTALPAGEQPEVQYLAIGRGGHQNVIGGNGDSLTDILQHRINNARLFEHLPFVLRPVNADLSAAERAKYRIRRLETYDGQQYFAYYLLKISTGSADATAEMITIEAGETTRTEYVPTASQLSPTPVSMVNGVVNQATGQHIAVTTPFPIELTASDIANILEAANIIYSDSRYAVISELGIVSGIDDTVTSTAGSVSVTYTEAKAAQIHTHIATNIPLLQQQDGVTMNFRIGTSLPYLT